MPITVANIRLHSYASTARLSDKVVLEYHRGTARLQPWFWPSTIHRRILPSELSSHRNSHRMLGPCCLCPMADQYAPDFVESAIYRKTDGPYSGEWVATCARNKCGYMVFMERLYDELGLPVKLYERRAFGERIPPRVVFHPENHHDGEVATMSPNPSAAVSGPSRPLKRTYAQAGEHYLSAPVSNTGTSIVKRRAPRYRSGNRGRKTPGELFEQLDARVKPGITAMQFKSIFAECECGLVTTRRAFLMHECIQDLSTDTDTE